MNTKLGLSIKSFSSIALSVLITLLFVAVSVHGATTISLNVSTDGTLSVTGASTLTGLTSMIQATSTRLSVVDTAYFGGTATSTFDSAGNLTVIGTLSVTGASTSTSATSTASIYSTILSAGIASFGETATSTFSSGGALTLITDLTLQNAETISNSTDGDITLGATNMVLVGTASTSALRVGDEADASTINGLVFGYCTIADTTITASSTGYADCASATGVVLGDRVFVQATSSLPENFIILSASSTAADTINVRMYNSENIAGNDTGVNSFNFWAVRD